MNFLNFLDNPFLIAKLQKSFGVEWKNQDPKNPLCPAEPTSTKENGFIKKKPSYVIKNKVLYNLAHIASEFAGKPFYYCFYPACQIFFDPGIARLTSLSLAVCMYIGQSLKGILRKPRPSTPPVIRLDELYEAEYGMPSTHALAAVCFSFGLLMYTAQVCEFSFLSGVITATIWSLFVSWARIYLGMHSILQISAGIFLGLGLTKILQPSIEWFHQYQLYSNDPYLPFTIIIITMLLCVLTFKLDRHLEDTGKLHWTTAPGDTTEILGWTTGFFLGTKYVIDHNIISIFTTTSNPLLLFNPDWISQYAIRYIFGGPCLMLPSSVIFKKSTLYFFRYAFGYANIPLDQAKKVYSVEICYKYCNSLVSGWFGVVVVPITLQYFNLW